METKFGPPKKLSMGSNIQTMFETLDIEFQ